MIDSIRLTNTEKDLLVRIKRKTGIESWNIICRWALSIGLSQKDFSFRQNPEKRDAIEIRWDTFAGKNKLVYEKAILLLLNAKNVPVDETFSFIHNQLEVGIRILATKCKENHVLPMYDLLNRG